MSNKPGAASRASKKPRNNNRGREVRVFASAQKIQLRTNSDGSKSATGYFAVFNTLSHDLGFREKLLPGCFKQSLLNNPVQCLFNHSSNQLLGRTESGTLQVQEDSKGLRFTVQIPPVSYGNDLVVLMERGDAFECSFSFSVPPGGDDWSELPSGEVLRVVRTAVLYEGSILVSPAAYPNTSASLRSCPIALRSKLKRKKKRDDSEMDDDAETDYEGCNGSYDSDDDDFDCPDEDDRSKTCSCDCQRCQNDACFECVNSQCASDYCARNSCPHQKDPKQRAANHDLATLRLKLKLANHRAKRFTSSSAR